MKGKPKAVAVREDCRGDGRDGQAARKTSEDSPHNHSI